MADTTATATATATEPAATTVPDTAPAPAPEPEPAPTAAPPPPMPRPPGSVALDAEFTLAPGQSATVDGGRLVVTFQVVTGDSRCPTTSGVACVWAGDATIEVTLALGPTGPGGPPGPTTTAELHTYSGYSSTAAAGRYQVALVRVAPEAPVDAPSSYRATFRASAS